MKSVLVIGMSRFGICLARKLQELGNEIMIIDKKAEKVERLASEFPDSQIGDCMDAEVIDALGVDDFDLCFVTASDDFESSLVITTLLKQAGAPHVVAVASQEIQKDILRKIGADEVIDPDREISEKLAVRYNSKNIFDYIPLTSEFAIYEIPILDEWVGRTIVEIDVRRKYRVNIVAIRNGKDFKCMPGAEYMFSRGDTVVVIGASADVFSLTARTR
ncbi:MAG: TrkA family potassium uptake protein [Clostridia bacterium]|nr:TrkA family potassium uptake protein [Clostridia bacterium]